jgi:rRNA maturation endonuclease Nob1
MTNDKQRKSGRVHAVVRQPPDAENAERVKIRRLRCHSCKSEWEQEEPGFECQSCGSLCTELLETYEQAV